MTTGEKGIEHIEMRRMCAEFGAGVVYTEMAVAMHLVRAPEETLRRLRFHESERPVFAQLAVGDVASAIHATKTI